MGLFSQTKLFRFRFNKSIQFNETTTPKSIIFVTPSLKGWAVNAKVTPSSYETSLTQLDTNAGFSSSEMINSDKTT